MARTRSEIEALVELNTGRTDKSTLMHSLCDSALKLAVTKHAFHDSFALCDDIAITEDATSVSISSLTKNSGTSIGSLIDIVSARIVEATKLTYTSGEHAAVVGDVITGATSGATAYVAYVDNTSGAWTGTAAGSLWICNKSGTFTDGEDIQDADTNTVAVVTTDPGAGGSKNSVLAIKNKIWWDKNIINPEDNQKGWPTYGLHFGSNIILGRPSDDGLLLRLRVSSVPTFADGDTECPIEVLDLFVEQYVTAMTYLSLGMNDKYLSWYLLALGRNYDRGEVGGTLLSAIDKDKSSGAEDRKVERGAVNRREGGITIENEITGSYNYGNTAHWY